MDWYAAAIRTHWNLPGWMQIQPLPWSAMAWVASTAAISPATLPYRVLSERIRQAYADGQTVRSPEYLFASAMEAANIAIYDAAQAEPEYSGMGTTVVAVILHGRTAYISHVGDSRVYLCRGGALTPLTRDHSVVQEMIESGQLTEEQAVPIRAGTSSPARWGLRRTNAASMTSDAAAGRSAAAVHRRPDQHGGDSRP